jgi:IS30 family transposase
MYLPQVDLIDMQSFPDGDYKYILVYQDHGIKFCVIEALTKKSKMAVALELLRIFSLLGPPMILQSDNGREFEKVCSILTTLVRSWYAISPQVAPFTSLLRLLGWGR